MVQELRLISKEVRFPDSAPAAYPVFFRTYSRKYNNKRENWSEVCDRTLTGLKKLGKLTDEQVALIDKMQKQLKSLTSGRWLWVGGTEWVERPENFSGSYNCTSTNVIDWRSFGLMMDLAMQGSGTGGVLEPQYISQLPVIINALQVQVIGAIGTTPAGDRRHNTDVEFDYANNAVKFFVGDSRQGWVKSYQSLLELSSNEQFDRTKPVQITVDISDVRPSGEALKGFGGMANPVKLPTLYDRCANILNKAIGRQLTSVECCLLIDEAAVCIVAGNIRRCLPEDALVHTSKGLVAIKDVQVGDLVQTPLGFRKVLNKFDQGMQEVQEIETNATFPRATINHRVAVLAEAKGSIRWKYVAALDEGDRLMHSTQILSGTVTHLPEDDTEQRPINSRTAKSITIPALIPEVAWLIGFTHGDGYVALGRNKHDKPYGRVEWAMNATQPELCQKLQAKIDEALAMFGLTATHGVVKGENTAKTVCSSIRLAEYFHEHINRPNTSLEVPSFILQGSTDLRAAYLAGLMDSDGAVDNRPPHLVTSVYQKFVRQVSAVLSSLGIAGRISITRPKEENWQAKYNLTIPALKDRYNALIAQHSVKGNIHQGLKMYGFTIAGEMMREAYTYSEMRDMGFQGSRTVNSNYERYITESDVSIDIPVSVKGLGSQDYVQTFDIEVEEAHCFYCDGYLTHNSAGMRQFSSEDALGSVAKDNLWQQDEAGNWRIDPERDSLRMANHTRVFHRKPTEQECVDAVRKQYYSGEGAIQWAGEAIARSNADLITTSELKREFLAAYIKGEGKEWLRSHQPEIAERELEHRFQRYGLNPCGEIVFSDGHCNLSEVHLNQIDPHNEKEQEEAFKAGAISVAALLNHRFNEERYRYSREVDPIVGVSFTGLFDFFVHAFGVDWLRWWEAGRPDTVQGLDFKDREAAYLNRWREIVNQTVNEYCDSQGLRRPNRCTTVQPAGCLDRTALRIFDQGLLYADEIVEAGSGESKGLDLSVRNGVATDTAIANQPLNLVRVTLENGRILRMTPNHRLAIADQWVRADQLELGMDIDYSLGEYQQQSDALLLSLNPVQYTREGRKELLGHGRGVLTAEITTPTTLNPELGYFLGCLFGDGAMSESKDRVRFAFNERELDLVERLQAIAQNQFGLTGTISHDPRDGGTRGELTFASGQLFDWIKLNQLQKVNSADLDRIPLAIRKSSRATILAFFCGLIDTDGCVREKGTLSIDSASEAFVRSLQQVGEAVGLCFGIFHNTQGENFQGQRNMWGLSLSRMLSQPDALAYLNAHSRKCKLRPLPEPKRQFAFHPYRVASIEFETTPDYSYDFAVSGRDDDDSWYWQGALKSHNTKSLLTGASPGWHPPKAQRFIRRITFRKDDPVARACMDYGYSIIPSQSDKDENGQLLNDPFDPRCTEWLVEIPVSVSWADLDGADQVEIAQFNVMAQFDFYMQVQKHYTRHNTSATLELREAEIEPLGKKIYEAIRDDDGYISAALLARFDDLQTFPRLPFEPIDKATYDRLSAEVLVRRKSDDFYASLLRYDSGEMMDAGPAGCDSDKCMFP
ncbi:MAG: ribonucleoside-triphosphate reductase [Pseudanabaena sp. CAN_BIN31]|nr:ribonucleoside-triphosphate reductase [Pseudanabaena sp. CAN_BIN31]